MPIYEYRCDQGHTFEVLQRMSDDPVQSCATCEAPVQRVFHPIAVHFKGSGFYNTDYGKRKRGGSGEGSDGEGGGKADGAGESQKPGEGGSSSESKGSSSDGKGSDGSKGSSDSGSKTASGAGSSAA